MRPVFSPDGKLLAVGNRNFETRLFDVATGKQLHKFPKRMTHEIAFSPDGKTIAAGYVDGTVALWDVATGKLRHSKPSGAKEIYSVDWNPRGDLLATGGRQGKILLWDPTSLAVVKELDEMTFAMQVRFTQDGTRLLTSGTPVYDRKDYRFTVWTVGVGGKITGQVPQSAPK